MAKAKRASTRPKPQRRQVKDMLAAAPVVRLTGVVDASGAAGLRAQGERLWTLQFTLAAWRVDGGEVQTRPMYVGQPISGRKLGAAQGRIRPLTILRMRARVEADGPAGPRARLLKIVGGGPPDKELRAYVARLKRPVRHADPLLGRFTLNRRLGEFDGKPKWAGRPVDLSINAPGDDITPGLGVARVLWQRQSQWTRRVTDYAVKRVLPLMNQWSQEEDGPPPVTEQALRRRIRLRSISVHDDRTVFFVYAAGEMLGYHDIQVRCDPKKGPTDADLIG